jgi:hypothetical protein
MKAASDLPIQSGEKAPVTSNVTVTNAAMRSFCWRVNPRFSRKATMYGLSVRCVISHLCQRSLPRAKQNAASSRNGVVGSSGVGMPITPKATQTKPAEM